MKTHFIYNRKSGQIVHTHISDEGQDTSKEGILHKAGSSLDKSDLDVLTAHEAVKAGPLRVDVEKMILVHDDDAKKNIAFGSAGLKKPHSGNLSGNVKTIYKKEK
jgi:hypothetical protein